MKEYDVEERDNDLISENACSVIFQQSAMISL